MDAKTDSSPRPSADERTASPTALPRILVGVATVIAILSAVSMWADTQALDTNQWVDTTDEMLADREIRTALSSYLVETVYEEVDVAAELARLVPEDFEGLAGPLSAVFRDPLTDGVDDLLDSTPVRNTWAEANRIAHETLVRVLRGEDDGRVSTADGSVTLDLSQLVDQVGEQVGLPDRALEAIPPDAGQIVIFESSELDTAQQAVRILDFLSWFLFLVVVALYALAIYLARGRRMTTLRSVGFGLAAAGLIVLMLRTIAIRLVLDAIVEDPSNEPVAKTVAALATGLLPEVAWSMVIYGVLIAVFAGLLGERRWAISARRTIAPALNASPGAVAAGTAVLVLLVVWWSPGRAFNRWATGLVFIGLIIGAVVALRRRTQTEFPDATLADTTGALTAAMGSGGGGPNLDAEPSVDPHGDPVLDSQGD